MRSEAATRILQAVAAVALAVVTVAVPLMLLVHVPAYTRALVRATGGPALAGIPASDALDAAEDVRRVVAGASEDGLPAEVAGREAFGPSERSHLADVREVVAGGRTAGVVAALVLAATALALARTRGRAALRTTLLWAGWGLIAFFALAALTGLADFDWLFTRFHGVFFASGTWTFPYSSLLIQLFPLQFWVVSGAVWAGSCLAGAVALLVVGHRQRAEEV